MGENVFYMLTGNNSISNRITTMGTKHKGSKKEIKILDAYIKFSRAYISLESQLSKHLSSNNITHSQFGVLEILFHLGPLNQKDIANKLLSSHSNLVTVLDNLEKNGVVVRERDQNDRRNFIIHLTEKGRKLIEDLFPRHLKLILERFGVLTDREITSLGRISKKIGLQD